MVLLFSMSMILVDLDKRFEHVLEDFRNSKQFWFSPDSEQDMFLRHDYFERGGERKRGRERERQTESEGGRERERKTEAESGARQSKEEGETGERKISRGRKRK